jgi:hypothetical protein
MERPAPIRSVRSLGCGSQRTRSAELQAKGAGQWTKLRFVALDVPAQTITVAVAEQNGEVRSLGATANRPDALLKLLKKLGPAGRLRVCYEAGTDRLRTLLGTDSARHRVRSYRALVDTGVSR